jgi:hypothetical protein
MQIDSGTLRLALTKVLVENGALTGRWLRYSEVAAAWPRTGMRGSDLRDAVHEMIESHDLAAADNDGALNLALAPGLRRSLSQFDAELTLVAVQDDVSLREAALRRLPHLDPGLRRRYDDDE